MQPQMSQSREEDSAESETKEDKKNGKKDLPSPNKQSFLESRLCDIRKNPQLKTKKLESNEPPPVPSAKGLA